MKIGLIAASRQDSEDSMVTLSGVLETDMDEGVKDEEESQEGVEDEEESEDGEDDLAEDNMRGDSLPEDNLAEYNTDNACVNKVNEELTLYKLASDNAFAVVKMVKMVKILERMQNVWTVLKRVNLAKRISVISLLYIKDGSISLK